MQTQMTRSQLDELKLEALNRTWKDLGLEEADLIDGEEEDEGEALDVCGDEDDR